jgi:hypothetical protein
VIVLNSLQVREANRREGEGRNAVIVVVIVIGETT